MKILYFLSAVVLFIYGFSTSAARLFSPSGLLFEEIVSLSLVGISSLVAFVLIALITSKDKRNIFSNIAVFLPFVGLLTIGLQTNGKIMLYLYPLIFVVASVLLGISFFGKNSKIS